MKSMGMKSNSVIQRLTYCALCTALLSVCAWLTIPLTVPVTMQSFAVFCTLLLLGGKQAWMAVAAYLMLGAVGLPIFHGFQGGIGILLGPTGGYLFGFLLMAALEWLLDTMMPQRTMRARSIVMGIELLCCYGLGTVWYCLLMEGTSIRTALMIGVIPFVLPDLAKLVLAFGVSRAIKKRI